MGEDCSGCRKWEEKMYWSHFQSVHFFLILPNTYDQQAIPQKFVNNLRGKLAGGSISLRGPGGSLWNVEVTAGGAGAGDTLFFKQGWKTFIEDHSLEENDFLIFKYNGGDSRIFDVLMFDKESFCEKECSYFVRKCITPDAVVGSSNGCKRKKENFLETEDVTPLEKRHRLSASAGGGGGGGGVRQESSSKPTTTTPTITPCYKLELSSNRRSVTMEEKEAALQKAHAAFASSEDSFLVIMQPSHVYKAFYMSIPIEWLKKNLPQKSRNLILRYNGSEWGVTFQRKLQNNGGLTVGWKKFVLDNCLEESDVCLFKPVGKTADAMVLEVSIFRVVEEEQVIPPSPATASPSSPVSLVMQSKAKARTLAVYLSNHRAKIRTDNSA